MGCTWLFLSVTILDAVGAVEAAECSWEESAMVQKAKGKPLTNELCPLPPGGAWADLELPGIKPFRMAVYENYDFVSKVARRMHNWEGFSPEHYGKPGRPCM